MATVSSTYLPPIILAKIIAKKRPANCGIVKRATIFNKIPNQTKKFCYFTVMGLPVHRLWSELAAFGVLPALHA